MKVFLEVKWSWTPSGTWFSSEKRKLTWNSLHLANQHILVADDGRWYLPKNLLQFWRSVTCFVIYIEVLSCIISIILVFFISVPPTTTPAPTTFPTQPIVNITFGFGVNTGIPMYTSLRPTHFPPYFDDDSMEQSTTYAPDMITTERMHHTSSRLVGKWTIRTTRLLLKSV